jgi:hypothetical protein
MSKYKYKKKRTVSCIICGTDIYTFFSRTKYCSYDCHLEGNKRKNKKTYNDNIIEYRERSRKWQEKDRERNPENHLFFNAKMRAKKKGIEFNITKEDVIIPEFCPILGIKLEKATNKPNNNSPSIDRIDNSKGYINGNIHVICHKANTIKNNASLEELKKITNYIENITKTTKKNK